MPRRYHPLPPVPNLHPIPIGERLRQLRRERRLSQRQLAAAAGLKQETISRLESGQTRYPQQCTLGSIACAFGMHPEPFMELLGMTGPRAYAGELKPTWEASDWAKSMAERFDRLSVARKYEVEGIISLLENAEKAEACDGHKTMLPELARKIRRRS